MTRCARCCVFGLLAFVVTGIASAAEGTLDTSFASNGKMRVVFDRGSTPAGKADHLIDILLQPDGKLLLFGSSNDDNDLVVAGIARLLPSGAYDNTFDDNGRLEVATLFALTPQAFTLQPDGKIIVAGLTELDQPILMRRAPDGSVANFPGSSFNAILVSLPGIDSIEFSQLAALPDGKFLAVGTAKINSSPGTDFFIARFQSEGALDSTFGTSSGFTRVNFALDSASADVARALAIASDGRIAVIGEVTASDREYGIAMFDAAGDPLMAFDGDGRAVLDFDIGMVSNDRGSAACFLPDGRLVVAGTVDDAVDGDRAGFALLGLTGALDSGFGTGGRRLFSVLARTLVADIACTADAKFLAIGTVERSDPTLAPTEVFVTRFDSDGDNDLGFGGSFGTVGFGINASGASGGREDLGRALVLAPGGRVYAGFDAQFSGEDYDYGVARLTGTQVFANGFE